MNIDPAWWVAGVFMSVFINLGLMIYFLYTKLDEVESFLYDVSFIRWYKNAFGTSLLGRQAGMNAISMVVMIPGLLQKRGALSNEAYLRLPCRLVMQIRGLYIFLYENCIAMIGIYILIF